jgi:hypothetical protein
MLIYIYKLQVSDLFVPGIKLVKFHYLIKLAPENRNVSI